MSRQSKLALLLAGLCGLLSTAQAQTSLPTVDVSGQRTSLALPPRVDVSQVCPGYGAQLVDRLSLPEVDHTIDMLVKFQLNAGEVTQVGFRHTPIEFRNQIRRVMADVSCRNDGQANQTFAFMLSLKPESQGGAQAVALKADSPALLALQAAD